jgi:DNA-binding HxlR family transcriptional regulator
MSGIMLLYYFMPVKNVLCPITEVAKVLSDTWTMLIMHFLLDAPKRFCDLERDLPSISTRTLTLKLKKLMEDGLVEKNKENMYTATKKGEGLRIIEEAMKKYQEKYLTL